MFSIKKDIRLLLKADIFLISNVSRSLYYDVGAFAPNYNACGLFRATRPLLPISCNRSAHAIYKTSLNLRSTRLLPFPGFLPDFLLIKLSHQSVRILFR